MAHLRLRLTAAALALGAATAACGQASTPQPSSSGSPAASTPTTPAASAAPDQHTVQLLAVGLGAYEETTVPVAIVKNLSNRSAATNLVVHFRVLNRANAPVDGNDAILPELPPGATAVVAARIQFAGTGFHGDATLTPGGFSAPSASPITASAATFSCGACGGSGYGDVHATLSSSNPHPRSPVYVGAACMNAAGAIVGGGFVPFHWPDAGGTSVPVVLTSIEQGPPVTSCTVTAMAAP